MVLTYINNFDPDKLRLRLKINNSNITEYMKSNVFRYNIKLLYLINQKNILFKILANELEPLTYFNTQIFLKTHNNENNTNKDIKYINNTLRIKDNIAIPITRDKSFFNYLIYNLAEYPDELQNYSTYTIILNYNSEIEFSSHLVLIDYLTQRYKSDVKIIFLYESDNVPDKLQQNNNNIYIFINKNEINKIINDNIINDDINNFITNIKNIIICDICNDFNKNIYEDIEKVEMKNLPFIIILLDILIKKIGIGCNLFIKNNIPIHTPTTELYFYISTLFERTKFLSDNNNPLQYGFMKYENLKHNKYNLNIITDKLLNEQNIKSIMKNKISDDFNDFIIDTYITRYKQIKKYYTRIKYLEELKDKLDVNAIISNNIEKSMSFCNKYNFVVDNIFQEFKNVNYDDIVRRYFILNKNMKPKDILLSIDSIFSITLPRNSEKMAKLIQYHFPSVKNIIDGNANIGAPAIVLSKYFNHIYSIEYSETTFEKLKHNIKIYDLKNVTVFNDDLILFMKKYTKLQSINFNVDSHCLFMDPPWTGSFYKLETTLNLYLSNIDILDFIKEIDIKYVCIKVPMNFNMIKLHKYFDKIIIYRLQGYYFILIIK